MLDNREKRLVTLAYYQGTCDNAKVMNELLSQKDRHKEDTLDQAVLYSTTKVLAELGLEFPSSWENEDLYKYLQEMEEITAYLCKEEKFN